ncbi:C2H2 type zinc-finger-domain-containing protein [Coniella lustricola]|uniref:C2H2 type zinc-finger-domain-containing protein n=1 Tax=Coniella lustricola TaxID=2025994 RepID=A0A2T3AAF3_9PEZI|nr:C2H2 type zinc-finger-domain-containing protein [Coniella lustricola]
MPSCLSPDARKQVSRNANLLNDIRTRLSPDTSAANTIEAADNGEHHSAQEPVFLSTQCLFCNALSASFTDNAVHMRKKHGLMIPSSIDGGDLVLAVDTEAIVQYMHLVVFDWHECLFCHTQRQSLHAVQQHMMSRGHCKIDLQEAESEFRDFYEGSQGDDGDEADSSNEMDNAFTTTLTENEHLTQRAKVATMQNGKLSLSSGKLLAHRSDPASRNHRHKQLAKYPAGTGRRGFDSFLEEAHLGPATQSLPADGTSPSPLCSSSPSSCPVALSSLQSQALTRTERRLLAHSKSALGNALANMSSRDRSALSHLSAVERRATIITQLKQRDRAQVAERRYQSKLEGRGNLVLMEHFKNDVPGPRTG